MLPIRLKVQNFLAYHHEQEIDFSALHVACLTGPNGAGKSSLLDAITWALWGKARTRSDDDLIHQGQREMLVQLDFWQEENQYRVVRKRQRAQTARGSGRSTLDLFAWDAEQNLWRPISQGSLRATNRAIEELLRLDYETFVNSAFLQQGRADAFTVKTPAKRKEILAEILGLNRWQRYEERAKARLRSIEDEVGRIDYTLDEITTQLAEEPALQRELVEAQTTLQAAEERRAEAEARYQAVAGVEDQMQTAKARLSQAEHRVRQHEKDLHETEREIARRSEQLAAQRAIVAEQETIEAGYAQLQAARERDRQLGEKLRELSALKDQLNALERRIAEARATLENEATAHRTRLQSAEQSAARLETLLEELAEAQKELAHLEEEEARQETLRAEVEALKEERASLDAENKALYEEMQKLKKRQGELQEAGAVCPLCGQGLDAAHKTSVLEEIAADGAARREIWVANKERVEEINTTLKAYQKELRRIGRALKTLPKTRTRAARLEAQVAEARQAQAAAQAARAELATVEAALDAGEYARELRAQRDTLHAQIEALGYDDDAHSAIKETLESYAAYDERQRQLQSALERLPELEASLEQAQARQTRWQEALAQELAAIEALRLEMAQLEEKVAEARKREEALRLCRTEEREAHERVVRAEQKLSALVSLRERQERLHTQRQQLAAQQNIFQELRLAFGKNGVPAMVIEAVIPELEETANVLLARMTDGRMHVRLDTQREKKTGGVAETLDILIGDELGTRSYELYSGGEAFRVNFAIRVALSQMLARRAGAQLRTLFIDEGFGTQDALGRQRLVEAINAVQEQFDLLLVITHIEELRDAFPAQLLVEKTPDGSRVTVQ